MGKIWRKKPQKEGKRIKCSSLVGPKCIGLKQKARARGPETAHAQKLYYYF